MSYAIETKKRKWDRLLESFNDGTSLHSRSSNLPNNVSTVSLVVEDGGDSAKRRRVTPLQNQLSRSASTVSLAANYLPSNRTAFLERLETFRHVTKWHIPSTDPINAAAWAKRGWTCVDTDLVVCGSCRAQILVKIDFDGDAEKENERDAEDGQVANTEEEEDLYTAAVEVYDGIVKRFQEMIVTGHAGACPWRRRGCDSSIQRIEGLLNTRHVLLTLRARYDSIETTTVDVANVNLPALQDSDVQPDITDFKFEENTTPKLGALRLAACGWQGKGDDVVECRHCFRSLGMWLYRGEDPAMERLDAVESHLDYCPWRSPEAQDTEISKHVQGDEPLAQTSEKVAGWTLVCQAMVAHQTRKHRASRQFGEEPRPTSAGSGDPPSRDELAEEVTPEQREKRMKALLKRINAVRKPFNVKALLKKKLKAKE